MNSYSKSQIRLTLLSVAIGSFMCQLDAGIVNVALPVIQNNFNISMSSTEWVVSAYLLTISCLLLICGKFADMIGYKKVYTTGFTIFTIGSLLCGLPMSFPILIVSRVIQASGAAMIFAAGPAIITAAVSNNNRGKALGIPAVAIGIALCMGPVLGGFLTSMFGWHSIFLINVPVGIIGTYLAHRNIHESEKKKRSSFDITGSLLFVFALLFLLFPLDSVGKAYMSILPFSVILAVGIILLVFFVLFERKKDNPMFMTSLFRVKSFATGGIAALFNFMAIYIFVFLVPFYLEDLRNFTTMQTGLIYMPFPIAFMLAAPFSGALSDRIGSRTLCSIGMTVMAAGLFLLSFAGINTPIYYLIIAMIIIGIGYGMFQTPNNSAIMGSVSSENRGIASATLSTLKNIGMVLGVAVSGTLFSLFQKLALNYYKAQNISGQILQDKTFTFALHITFIVAGLVALLAVVPSLMMEKTNDSVQ
jgi:EmrB/QacA subfamily drug resistance transporter